MKASVANGISLVSGFLSVLPFGCCVFPVALSFTGASGFAFAMTLAPYRPYFLGLALISLAAGFYFTYKVDCGEDSCGTPRRRKLQLLSLWIATILVLAMLAFPYLVPFLPV